MHIKIAVFFIFCFSFIFSAERVLILPPAYSPEQKEFALKVTDEFKKLTVLNKRFSVVPDAEAELNLKELFPRRINPILREMQIAGSSCRAAKVFYLEALNNSAGVEYSVSFYDTQSGKLIYQNRGVTQYRPEVLAGILYKEIQPNLLPRQDYINILNTLQMTQSSLDIIENSGGTVSGALALNKYGVTFEEYRFILQLGGSAHEFVNLLKNSKINTQSEKYKQTQYYLLFLKQKYRVNI